MPGIALTTTARNLDQTFRDWCFYHLQVVDRLLIWLDNPAEANHPDLPSDPRIRFFIGSQMRRGTVHGDLMLRQDHNTDQALRLCNREKLDWLLHLDTDELLYPADRTLLLKTLGRSHDHVTMLNHEVCPQWECDNPFRQCNFFKLNGRIPFNLYLNGKSGVRCSSAVYARDAHSFGGYAGQQVTTSDLVILHYACPTYERWIAKYSALGDFPDFWWDNPGHRIHMSFHTTSRDILRDCRRIKDFRKAKEFWATQVLNEHALKHLLATDKVARFAPMDRLA